MDNEQLIDYFEENITYETASKGKRLANYIIDRVAVALIVIGSMLVLLDNETLVEVEDMNRLLDYLITAFFAVIYYSISETLLNGKTLGKYLTGTRAVTVDNERIDFPAALTRSFSRIVPFEAFSFLGDGNTGWHDKWSETKVVD